MKKTNVFVKELLKKSELNFIFYDLVTDCINPIMGETLATVSDSPLEKYHAFRNNEFDYDADASYEACSIYELAFPFMKNCGKNGKGDIEIIVQGGDDARYNRYELKHEIKVDYIDYTFRGDTMNSVATSLRAFYKIMGVEEELPEQALTFIDSYHTPGNFMVIPYKYGYGLNAPRGIGATKDFIDLYLLAIYNYYNDAQDTTWSLQKVYGYRKPQLISFFVEYLNTFRKNGKPSWDVYVEENLFQDFVENMSDGSFGIPRELWKGHFENSEKRDAVLPENIEDCLQFWENATSQIQKRGSRMYKRIHS